ncbi:DUF3592 domain-containing protein [Pseudomonas sp. LFM046]|uniref:DUF3592 domain-containing protein n=1 Tax=Pseudomonas sp. LFM046 TaxID=1608357 RepID=UPI0005CF98F1|nr:DUF3592 domain-containing protein [Pseudomonas sp. LFM046]
MNILKALGYAALAVGVAVAAKHQMASRSWTETTATIRQAQVSKESQSRKEYNRDGRRYTLTVYYTYEVNGIRYPGDYPLPETYRFRDSAERAARNDYAPGRPIRIIYDPARPEQSEPKRKGTSVVIKL